MASKIGLEGQALFLGLLLAAFSVPTEADAKGPLRPFLGGSNIIVAGSEELPEEDMICLRGRLTDEGIECPALRSDSQSLYTLAGEVAPFEVGDDLCVCGIVAEVSFCMQGTTITVTQISAGEQGCPP